MNIAVGDAALQLADLIRRAEAGEEVVLTRDGQAVVRITSVAAPETAEERQARIAAAILKAQAGARAHLRPGPGAARSQDFLYDEDGLPR